MSASFYDLMKFAKTGIAAPSMTFYDMQKARAMFGGGGFPVATISGVPPISFKSDGSALTAWSISGNMVQTPPEECGNATGQMFDISTKQAGVYLSANGNPYASADDSWRSPKITASGGETYTLSLYCSAITSIRLLEWSDNAYIGNTPLYSQTGTIKLTVTLNESTTKIAFNVEGDNAPYAESVMLNAGSEALPFAPNAYAIPISCGGTTQTVYLSEPLRKALDGSDAVDVMRSDGTITREVDSNGDALVTPTTETFDAPTITPAKGANTLTVGTTLPPSEVSITGHIQAAT